MAINKLKFALIMALVVNKKDETNKGKYLEVGKVNLYVPTLADAGVEAEQAIGEDKKPMFEDGIPVYTDDVHNWLQNAMLAQAKAQARNKLISGTATLKDGKTIADDWEAMTAESEGVGNPAALLAVREAKTAFGKWVAGLGKSTAAQQLLTTLFGSKQSLAVQSSENKEKMSNYVGEFAETLDAETLAKWQRYIQSVLDACQPVEDATDF